MTWYPYCMNLIIIANPKKEAFINKYDCCDYDYYYIKKFNDNYRFVKL
jgi:hypothetical protein